MKYLFLFILLFAFSTGEAQIASDSSIVSNKTQTQIDDEHKVFTLSEVAVSYPKGEKSLFKYIDDNINRKTLLENGASKGNYKITIRFIVRMDGSAYDFVAESKNGFGLEDETIRVLKTIQKWEPARQNNRKVYAYYRRPIPLNL
jgi:hypothetical protein